MITADQMRRDYEGVIRWVGLMSWVGGFICGAIIGATPFVIAACIK